MARRARSIALLGVLLASTTPASALAPSPTLTGRVTDAGGAPIRSICVRAEGLLPGQQAFALTQDDGTYALTDLQPGVYQIEFTDCHLFRAQPFAPEWYDDATDKADAERIIVGLDDVTGIDAQLILKGVIRGRVTDQFGAPAAGLCVASVEDGYGYRTVHTYPDGSYEIPGDDDTPYAVRFGGCTPWPQYEVYVEEWFDEAPSIAEAEPVMVTRGTETVIDAVVERTGTISGTVVDQDGNGVSMCAVAHTPDGEIASYAEVYSDPYRIGGLRTGTYYVKFFDCHVGGVVDEWYGDALDMESSTPVAVQWGYDTSGIDAVVARTGTVSGRLTDAAGNPIQTCVSAMRPGEYPYVGGASNEDGYYTLPKVQPEIQLAFGGDCTEFPAEYYDDAFSREEADIVHIPPGVDVTGIDAVIDPSAGPGPCEGDDGDIDNDGLNNCEEFVIYGTNAFDPDSDNDQFGDRFEVKGGTCGVYRFDGGSDPNDGSSTPPGDLPVAPPAYNAPYAYLVVLCP